MPIIRAFGPFRLDISSGILFRGAEPLPVGRRAVALLRALIEQPGTPVAKGALIEAAWPGQAVEESNLSVQIASLRRVLGETAGGERWIETLPRHGYRFVGPVATDENADAPAPSPSGAHSLTLPDRPSIAILPFSNLSSDPEQDYFADGITDDIITALSYWRWLFVIARNSTFAYKGRNVDVRQVGNELGVRYVLVGSVRRSADRVRITTQLVETESGAHLWANRYDRPLNDLFKVQDDIAAAISATVEPEIGDSERARSRRKPPESLGAWELFQRGMWHLLRYNFQDSTKAEGFFQQSIALDPDFAPPHAALAVLLFFRIVHASETDHADILTEMCQRARTAIEIDPKDFLGHTALGLYLMERKEFAQSIAEHKTALGLNANSPLAHWACGYVLLRDDRFPEALQEFDLALRLNPRDRANLTRFLTLKAATLYQLGRYEEAATCARDATRGPTSDVLWPHIFLAAALGQLDRGEEAGLAAAELHRRRPGLTISGFAQWAYNQNRSTMTLARITEGLRKAALPD